MTKENGSGRVKCDGMKAGRTREGDVKEKEMQKGKKYDRWCEKGH